MCVARQSASSRLRWNLAQQKDRRPYDLCWERNGGMGVLGEGLEGALAATARYAEAGRREKRE